jgi:Zn/Cd-binding protein ZinT
MIPYKLDYTIEKVLQTNQEQTFNKTLQDHKWYLSERLGRDVGLFVAALDYFLNIQKLPSTPKTAN